MITKAQINSYASGDIIKFLEEQYYVQDKRGRHPIVLEDWQKEQILKPLFYDLDENGRRKYDIALIGMPKKNGKSALAGGIGVYFLICDEPDGEVVIGANAKDQASMIIYNRIRQSIKQNLDLGHLCKLYKSFIEASNGSKCFAVANQFDTVAGLNPNCTLFDELWGFTGREFFDELTTVPTRINPLTVIVTYAGYEKSGLLWDLYQDGMAGPDIMTIPNKEIYIKRGYNDSHMFFYWSHENQASWVTPEYLKNKQNKMPTASYMRLHENRWVADVGQFITQADIDRITNALWRYQHVPMLDKGYKYVMGSDLGLSNDRTAVAIAHFDNSDKRVYLDNLRLWQGSADEHVPIDEVEAYMLEQAYRFQIRELAVDPWQLEHTIQRMRGIYPVYEFNFATEMTRLSQAIFNAIRTGTLQSYAEATEFFTELKASVVRQTPRGWKLEHTAKSKNDCIVSVGMALLRAFHLAQYAPMIYG